MVTVTSASQNHIFDDAKIIVIKVGSSLLVAEDQNAINTAWLSGIATDIARLKADGKDVGGDSGEHHDHSEWAYPSHLLCP